MEVELGNVESSLGNAEGQHKRVKQKPKNVEGLLQTVEPLKHMHEIPHLPIIRRKSKSTEIPKTNSSLK
ncbi:hypothetical protein B4U37_13530 [Sutcliffiella horikoshii]|uniref:Uncharacterized protein n=1 Tax=Sutcliffiella horikoshii TaxID=79883 RepID=A0ABM6KL36_9BACI|nr:hypothetical protein B4U37_13530 [Sutcliffiella horikoshii]